MGAYIRLVAKSDKGCSPLSECSLDSFANSILSNYARLLTQSESLYYGTITCDVAALEIVEEATTLTYESREGTLSAMVLAVLLHVLGKV